MKTLKMITKKGMILSLVLATGLTGSAIANAQTNANNQKSQSLLGDSTMNFQKVELQGAQELSKQNAKLIQEFYNAFLRGDMETVTKLTSSDFIMHVPGKGLNAGEYWGA